jgi:hypothetical protein
MNRMLTTLGAAVLLTAIAGCEASSSSPSPSSPASTPGSPASTPGSPPTKPSSPPTKPSSPEASTSTPGTYSFSWPAPIEINPRDNDSYQVTIKPPYILEEVHFKDAAGGAHILNVTSSQEAGSTDAMGKLTTHLVIHGVWVEKQKVSELPAWRELGRRLRDAKGASEAAVQRLSKKLLCVRVDEDGTTCPK